jgi:hypothetical protein
MGSTALAAGRLTIAYVAAVQAVGGGGTYRWAVTSGALPAGLVLDGATGAIGGTPLTAGTFTGTLGVADATDPSNSASAPLSITIATAPIRVTTAALPSGRATSPYSTTVQAAGGGGIRWAVTGGALPAGLRLVSTTGAISGTPTTPGSYAVTVTATDTSDATNVATAQYAVTIAAAVRLTSPRTIPVAQKGAPYVYPLLAANTLGAVKWSLSGGAMPPGMTLNAKTGVITGTCLAAGRWSFTARVKDSSTVATLAVTILVK